LVNGIIGKIKAMFQTTNQVTYMSNVCVDSCLRNSVHISSIFESAPRCFKWGEQTTSNGAIPRSEKKNAGVLTTQRSLYGRNNMEQLTRGLSST
jgi:Na+-translocating ferredoxin:NAD+ oxidoreductase RNF subunit RnfB